MTALRDDSRIGILKTRPLRADPPLCVCLMTNLFPPVVSGSSTQTSALARELAARGHEIVVVTARLERDTPPYERADGVHVYRLPAVRLPKLSIALKFPWLNCTFWPRNVGRVARIVERHRPDLLHLHNHMFDMAFTAVRMKKRFALPLVVTIHTMIRHARPLFNLLLRPADRVFLKRAVIRHADALLCPDVNILEYVEDAFGGSRATVLPYGISLPGDCDPSRVEELRARHGLYGRRVILSVGHVHEIRNRRDLVEAMPHVLQEMPEALLLIVGAVSTDETANLARRLGVEDAVLFTGETPHADVSAYFALADVEAHWLNQDLPEKTSPGIASLEAMGAGLPIVSAANPDTYGAGLLRDGENLLLARPGDPQTLARTLVELLGDESRRRSIGRKARRTIEENFSWKSICSRTLEVYRRAIRRQPQPARRAA